MMSKSTKKNFYEKLEKCSKQLILHDGLTLVNSLLKNRDSVFVLGMIPYLSLFCNSAQDFFDVKIHNDSITVKVYDIRNGIKVFTDKYGKSKKIANKLDFQQDNKFKEMLRFKFSKKFNLHYNLGIYFTETNRIIFNTQLASSIFTDQDNSTEAYILGEQLGRLSARLLTDNFSIDNSALENLKFGNPPKFGYVDYNTNRMGKAYNKNLTREDNLILLHVLSMLGFVNNYLRDIYENDNLFMHRVTYIVVHNTVLFLRKFLAHLEQNDKIFDIVQLESIIAESEGLLSTEYRNVMMHYSLVYKDNPAIKIEFFDEKVPFFGLVESCFLGEDIQSYNRKLFIYADKLERYIETNFTFDYSRVNYN